MASQAASAPAAASAAAAAPVNDDPRMGTLIKHLSLEQFESLQAASSSVAGQRRTAVVVAGFPHDEGCRRNGGRVGAAGGPACVRGFMSKMGTVLNPEHKVDLSTLDHFDVGDVAAELDLESAHVSLEQRITRLLQAGPHVIPFVIGGSNDQSYPNAAALMNALGHGNIGVVNIDAHLDVRPLKEGKVHSGSSFRQLLEDPRFAAAVKTSNERSSDAAAGPSHHFLEFAAQGSQCSQAHADFVTATHKQRIVWHSQLTSSGMTPVMRFQMELAFLQGDALFVSFDLDAVQGSDAPGVSCPGTIGLSAHDAVWMCYYAGLNPRVRLFDLSEFNPAVDSYRTGRLVANMWYFFCMGVAGRGATAVVSVKKPEQTKAVMQGIDSAGELKFKGM